MTGFVIWKSIFAVSIIDTGLSLILVNRWGGGTGGIIWTVKHSFYRSGDLTPSPRTRVETPGSLVSPGLWGRGHGACRLPRSGLRAQIQATKKLFLKEERALDSWFERLQSFVTEKAQRHPASAINQINAGAQPVFYTLPFSSVQDTGLGDGGAHLKKAPEGDARGWHLPPPPTYTQDDEPWYNIMIWNK